MGKLNIWLSGLLSAPLLSSTLDMLPKHTVLVARGDPGYEIHPRTSSMLDHNALPMPWIKLCTQVQPNTSNMLDSEMCELVLQWLWLHFGLSCEPTLASLSAGPSHLRLQSTLSWLSWAGFERLSRPEPTQPLILITLIGSLCHRSLLPHGPHILVYQIDALSLSFPLTGPAVSSFANAKCWHHLWILTYAPTLVCSFKSLNPGSDLSDLFRHSQGFWVRQSVRWATCHQVFITSL